MVHSLCMSRKLYNTRQLHNEIASVLSSSSEIINQETLVFRYGSVVQTTSESSADRLKVDRTAESNRIHIFGNDSDQGRRIQILQIFNPFFDTTFLLKS